MMSPGLRDIFVQTICRKIGEPVDGAIEEAERVAREEAERRAREEADSNLIRKYAAQNPLLQQHEIAAWVTREFGHNISQSKICETLKPKYAFLDKKTFARGVDLMEDFRFLKKPSFSHGWLEDFKRRYKIKQYKQSGQAASADIEGARE
ncbi:hypothetical protein B0T24DRAFT_681871 [Lasiosphaeria ovina]|uniref:ARS-binding protein 1 N-terminal domain-containing protein n=1 Tax=Lasiosphaeria ovina TaxID=92902 RepID=A0AAE0JZ41_9PEZI|nr:hypothetical protein B0T24DRAFT_681871 [Lasiosphaeria ovina]